MDSWRDVVVWPDTPLGETLRRIESSAMQIALIVDREERLIGVLTDGDIRRAVIEGVSIGEPTSKAMNPYPRSLSVGTGAEEALNYMRRYSIHHVPLTDEAGRLVGVYFIDELVGVIRRPNPVILMAGGMGMRLRPLTESCPKPLLPVGGKPILERIIDRFVEQGFHRFFVAVNYMADMIVNHFGDGERWSVDIQYLRESEQLGTAGALSLLPERFEHPLVVMNGDLLTEADFGAMLKEHRSRRAVATMAVREYEMQVPYGVVEAKDGFIAAIQEKPVHKFLVNAGIYVLQPEALDQLEDYGRLDMPDLFERLKATGPTFAYVLREYWVDIGRLEDLESAQFALQTRG